MQGPHAGLVIGWERRGERWFAQVAYVIEGDEALIVQWLPDDLLRPAKRLTGLGASSSDLGYVADDASFLRAGRGSSQAKAMERTVVGVSQSFRTGGGSRESGVD